MTMSQTQSLPAWMTERRMGLEDLEQLSCLDRKVLQAIYDGRYTPSPQQRKRVADALGVDVEQIAWGHTNPVTHLYGHGPQFGRTP